MRKILDTFYWGCAFLAGSSLVLMVTLVLLQIITRFFNSYIPSSDDISGYMVAWTTFLGVAYAMKKNDHIRVDILFNLVSPAVQWMLNTIVNTLGGLLMTVFLFYVYSLVKEAYDYGDMTTGFVPLPLWLVQLPYLLGVFALWVAVLDRLITMLLEKQKLKQDKSPSEKS